MKTAIRGCSTTNVQSNAGSRGRSGRPGSSPIWMATRKSNAATTKSRRVSTTRLEASVR